jgi:hypothetical protein
MHGLHAAEMDCGVSDEGPLIENASIDSFRQPAARKSPSYRSFELGAILRSFPK